MSKQQPRPALRVEAHRHQGGNATNEAVHQHCDPLLGAADVGTGQGSNLETADTTQCLQWVCGLQAMQAQRPLDDLGLVLHASVVQAGARAAQFSSRAA
ncbi:hypothetical protein D3C76_1110240 [compost metagenome]